MKKNKLYIVGWVIIALAILSVVFIYLIEGFSWMLLIPLLTNLLASGIFRKLFSSNAIAVSRILIGFLFIFSGFVKGVDPMGTIFKMEEYMIAYGTEWAIPIVPFVAILMITAEFSFGCFAVLNIKPKFTAICISLMMIGFTTLTLLDALNNPVADCGCFGDAVKMSNWQTFYKNLVIDTLLLAVIFNYRRLRTKRSNISQFSIAGFIVCMFVGIQIYAYFHKPIIDFLPWKEGTIVVDKNRKPVEIYLLYKNKQTGETQEYTAETLPYSDENWLANWEFVSRREIDPNKATHSLHVTDEYGDDITESILEDEAPILIVTLYNIEKCHTKALLKLEKLYFESLEHGYNFVMIVAATPEEINAFAEKNAIPYPIYIADDVELKMMNRSNPGLMLLQNNKVQKKWDYNDIPDYKRLEINNIK